MDIYRAHKILHFWYRFYIDWPISFNFCFCFLGMADFQYLPIVKGNDGNMEQIHDKIVFNTFMDRNEFLDRDVPVFLPPVIFSR